MPSCTHVGLFSVSVSESSSSNMGWVKKKEPPRAQLQPTATIQENINPRDPHGRGHAAPPAADSGHTVVAIKASLGIGGGCG